MITSFNQVLELARSKKEKKICVVNAHDDDVLKSISEAHKHGLAYSILVGNEEIIQKLAKDNEIDISSCEIINEKDYFKAAQKAVSLVNENKADLLMKGKIQTPDLIKAVLSKEYGLRTSELLSHIGLFESSQYHKLLIITDGGLNIAPDINKKVSIINNAVRLAKAFGINTPKVAGLSAIELVNPDMPSTMDAAAITIMNKRGQLKNCIFEGPLALDNAISEESAKIKGIDSDIAGDVDILLVPDIESGNILMKGLTYLSNATWGGVVIGAKCPIILSSRSDSYEVKLNSIAIGLAMLD